MPIERNFIVAISQSVAFEPVISTSEQIYVAFPARTLGNNQSLSSNFLTSARLDQTEFAVSTAQQAA